MTGCGAVLADMSSEQLVGPKLVRVSQLLRLLAGAVPHPGFCIVRQPPWLSRSGQLLQCCLQPGLKALPDAKQHRATADLMAPGDRLVAVTGERIEKNSS